ncbi:MAG: hypothetical protein NOU37_09285 [Candidatus Brocadiales bacterium]|nr:hypothetical protein [Candidatus Bathyanammoxibius amoris]
MAENLGGVLLHLKTDGKKFDKGIDAAHKKTKKLDKSFGKASKSAKHLKSSLLAIGAALAVGTGLAIAIKKIANMGDQLAKMSKRVNISVERLSSFRLATELAGTSLEAFGKAQQKLARTMVDANRGLETYTREFDELGITLTDKSGRLKTTEEVFYEIADAVKELGVSTETTSALMALMGRGGVQMTNLMIQGSAAIKEQEADAIRLGAVWDEMGAQKAEAFNDALTRLKFAFLGIAKSLAVAVFPALTKVINWFTNLVVKIRGIKTALSSLDPEVKAHLESLASLAFTLAKTTALIVGISAALLITAKAMSILTKSMLLAHGVMLLFEAHPIILGITLLTAAVVIAAAKFDIVREKLEGLMRSVGAAPLLDMAKQIKEELGALDTVIKELDKTFKKQKTTVDQLTFSQGAYNAAQEKGQQIAVSLRTPREVFNNQIRALNNMLVVGAINWETYGRATKKAQGDLAATRLESKLVSAAFDEMSSTIDISIEGVIQGTQSLSEAFRNMVRNILLSLQKMLIQELILAPIKAGILGALSGGLNTSSGLGIIKSQATIPALKPHTGGVIGRDDFRLPRIEVPSSAFANAPRFHVGGLARDDIPAVLQRGEGVFTPAQMKALGARSQENNIIVNQTLNISPGVPEAVRREVVALLPQMEKHAVAAVRRERGRGGAFSRDFGMRR